MVRNHKLDRQHICSCKERSFGNIFFERPAQDSACFIDIAEKKYLTTAQIKKKKLVRSDWDIDADHKPPRLVRRGTTNIHAHEIVKTCR